MTVKAMPALALGSLLCLGGCATTPVEPIATLPPDPPAYVAVPHPDGSGLGDLMGVFTEKGAPSPGAYAGCDKKFQELRVKTRSKDELERGVREFVRTDPVHYHWCFYTKLYEMEEGLRSDEYIDEKQKRVLEAYLFLTPVARGFMQEFNDSRYYRWAVVRYRRLSEYVFYRKLELSAQTANELMGATSTLGVQRRDAEPASVLEKYGLAPIVPPGQLSPAARQAAQGGTTGNGAVDPNTVVNLDAAIEWLKKGADGEATEVGQTAPATEPAAAAPAAGVEPIVVRAKTEAARAPASDAKSVATDELPARADHEAPAKGVMLLPAEGAE